MKTAIYITIAVIVIAATSCTSIGVERTYKVAFGALDASVTLTPVK
jgi:hypothetical protein